MEGNNINEFINQIETLNELDSFKLGFYIVWINNYAELLFLFKKNSE